MDVVIRADGGPEIGYGHLMRSNALGEELSSRGHDVTFATTTPAAACEVASCASRVVEIASRTAPEPFVACIERNDPDVVFTDAYPADTAYQQVVADHCPQVVWQDDDRHAVCADVFVNGNLYAPDLDYEFVRDGTRTCLGAEYALLRERIRELANQRPPWRETPSKAVVTMGGSDVAEMTSTVARAFDGVSVQVDVVVGPGFSGRQEEKIGETVARTDTDMRIVRDPDDLAGRLFRADFAVSTASSTTYELLALGTPIVSIPVVDNQEPIAAALRERDAATVLDRCAGTEACQGAVEQYLTDSELRRERQVRGRALVDGRGVERTADVIHAVVES